MTNMIFDSAKRLFAQYPVAPDGQDGVWNPTLWRAVEEAGFTLALLSEDEGGFGLEPADALGLLQIAAARAATIPLGETMVANWLLAKAGLPLAEGPAGFAPQGAPEGIACGRHLNTLVLYAAEGEEARLVHLDLSGMSEAWKEGENIAGEPRDIFAGTANQAAAIAPVGTPVIEALAALVRTQQMAGALQAVLDMTVEYATQRVQFGRPLGKFQAIQQYLAVMAGEVAASRAAALMAAQ
ncbi:acyl-CoA dehydrogenase, partial [Agrobacterium tumefaciens]